MGKYFENKTFLTGFLLFLSVFLLMCVGFFYLPFEVNQINASEKFISFSKNHLLGTDNLGRDVLSRVMVGARISILLGFCVVVFGFVVGGFLGSISGYFGGKIDFIVMKLVSTQMAFPGILLALMLVAVFEPDLKTTFFALCIMSIPRFTRISRAGFIKYKNALFVQAAKVKGASDFRIMFVHILPNILSELFITATSSFSMAILSESGLSYLGLGIQPPNPSFGRILNEAQQYIFLNPWGVLLPLGVLCILVLGINLIGDGISEVNRK